jgi:eukaryotic-like serine/threonine-protein kinase
MSDPLGPLIAALSGRYLIERVLGQGGMATVYLATDLVRQRPVAIKVLRPELAAALGEGRFLQEIRVTASLDHPHIVPLFDSGEASGVLYYAMPYVEGESVAERLSREKRLPVSEALRIIREVASALQYAHERGIIHRDIKPQNIMLSAGHARVADFGIARAVRVAGVDKLTGTGFAVGTPHYMSPEQSAGDEVDARSDIYSLTTVLYEMLAGEPPFTGPSMQAIIAKRLREPVPRVSTVRETVSPALEAAITRGLAKDPVDRFQTIAEFSAALDRAQHHPAEGIAPRVSLSRRTLLGAGVAATAILAIAGYFALQGPPAQRIERLAVLPLENRLNDTTRNYLVTGMHEALITELAQLGSVSVLARSAVMRYAGGTKTDEEISKELRADALIRGTVEPSGDSLSVTVNLINTVDATQQTRVFPTTVAGAMALFRQVARTISVLLGAGDSLAGSHAPRALADSAAQEAYLKARYHASRGAPQDVELTQKYLDESLRADSAFAPAHALLSQHQITLMFRGALPPHEAFDRAKTSARRAIALDESLAEAHYQLGYALALFDWDWAAAEREFKRAIQLNPSNAEAIGLYGFFLSWMKRHDEALVYANRAAALDPVSVVALNNVATVLMLGQRYDEGIAKAKEALTLDPNLMLAWERLGMMHEAKKAYPEALEAYRRALAIYPGDPARLGSIAGVLAKMGRADTARVVLAELLAREKQSYVPAFAIATVYVGLGEVDHALDWVERAFRGRYAEMVALQVSPAWDPLRSHPRFQDLLARMKFP